MVSEIAAKRFDSKSNGSLFLKVRETKSGRYCTATMARFVRYHSGSITVFHASI